MSELKKVLYGRTEKVKLADGNEYSLREPSIDSLENLDFNTDSLSDLKSVKKLAWTLLKDDNPGLTEDTFGRLITISMMRDGSDFMQAFHKVLGNDGGKTGKN